MRLRSPLLLVLCACGPQIEGNWTGVCATETVDARVELDVMQDSETEVWRASGFVHLASRQHEALVLTCGNVDVDGSVLDVAGCEGAWNVEGAVHDALDFEVHGTADNASPTPVMSGTCTFEGAEGVLELWRTS